jgi:hypothetical protein
MSKSCNNFRINLHFSANLSLFVILFTMPFHYFLGIILISHKYFDETKKITINMYIYY